MSLVLLVVLAAAPVQDTVTRDGEKVAVVFAPGRTRGERIYKTYCHHCHGERGDGSGHIGRGLQVKPVDLTADEAAARMTADAVTRVVRDGSNKPNAAMIPWKLVLSDDQIRDVASYTSALAASARAARETQRRTGKTD